MSNPRHLLVRASAGTGKTYQLTNRYLALLLDGADPDRILATTFTRKAAHEILDRVLERLAGAARGGKGLEELRATLGAAVTQERCGEVLARLLRGMDRLRISTIDSWFAQLGRLAALDLGLPPGWRIADEPEAEALRSEAVAEAVRGADRPELLALLRDLAGDAEGQSVHDHLLRFAREGREALLESLPEAWARIEPLPDVDEAELQRAVAALPTMRLALTRKDLPRSNWVKAHNRILEILGRGDWLALLDETLVQRALAGPAVYDKAGIRDEQRAVLVPLATRALHLRTRRIVQQNAAARALLERIETAFRALEREQGRLRFEDLPDALAPVTGEGPLAARGIDLEHRLDGRIDHLLLDEFQDTAPVQWRVLRPLADSILAASQDRSFFCVGDEKQSIYGWRAAEPRLLRGMRAKRPMLDEEPLHTSYRSSSFVLDVVNRVFGSIAANPAFGEDRPEAVAAAAEFQAAFHEHVPARDKPGAVHVLRARPAAEREDAHDPVLALCAARVRAILDEAPRASVGVLVRRRAWIPDLILRLRNLGIAASDQGGNPLTDSAAVLHALSLLHLADHPGDLAAAFHVATSPLGPRVGLAPPGFREGAGIVAREIREALARQGYGAFLASIRPEAGGEYADWDLRRFGQLVDLALAWESRAGSRPRAFVEHVRAAKVEDPSAAQVRVMTVHGAKGLEFDAVLLPELDRAMIRGGRGLLTDRPDPEGPIGTVSHGLCKEVSPAHAELDALRAGVERRRALEELCVMYVAMTRAVHRLDLVMQGREEEGGGLTWAAILRAALDVEAEGPEGVAWNHAAEKGSWFPPALARPQEAGDAAEEPPALRLAPSKRPRALTAVSPSAAKDRRCVAPSFLLLPKDRVTARGRLVHRWLEEVEWLEAFDKSDEELLALGSEVTPDTKLLASALAGFRAMLEKPGTKRLLSRPGEGYEAWRERGFTLVVEGEDGAEELWTGAFDRVVVRRERGTVVDAEVLDFKTDRVEGEALRARAESYRPQMQAYRRALARITGLPETSIRTRILFLHADEAVEA